MTALSTAPFQAGPSAEANFERIVNAQQHRSGVPSPAAATCDTASVRSIDTSVNVTLDELENEPQVSQQKYCLEQGQAQGYHLACPFICISIVSEGITYA